MNKQNNGENELIVAIINIYFKISKTKVDELKELALNLINLIEKLFPDELSSSALPVLPYKDITEYVFHNSEKILSDSIYGFRENISDQLEGKEEKFKEKIFQIHDKLVEHTLLAQVQRDFIRNNIASSAQSANKVAQDAEKIANEAKQTSKNAEETYKSMFANYITILGIFTAIIVTIFGGLNTINTVSNNIFQEKSIVLELAGLIVLCTLILLYFLANIIHTLANSNNEKTKTIKKIDILLAILSFLCVLIIAHSEKIP